MFLFSFLDFTKQVSAKGKTMSETVRGQQCFPGSKGMATKPLAGDVLVDLSFTLYDARKSEFSTAPDEVTAKNVPKVRRHNGGEAKRA